jgi:hypothetical protein
MDRRSHITSDYTDLSILPVGKIGERLSAGGFDLFGRERL